MNACRDPKLQCNPECRDAVSLHIQSAALHKARCSTPAAASAVEMLAGRAPSLTELKKGCGRGIGGFAAVPSSARGAAPSLTGVAMTFLGTGVGGCNLGAAAPSAVCVHIHSKEARHDSGLDHAAQ